MGRPPDYDQSWVRVHTRYPPVLLTELDRIAVNMSVKRDELVTEILRGWVDAYLAQQQASS